MADSTRKGRLVEQVVAKLHETPGVTIQTRVMLPPKSGKGGKREVDVLLSSEIAGYPVRIAIECKNVDSSIQAPVVDSFVGKLQYLGIPVQHGIIVATRGFTKGAIERAAEAGIKLFDVTGLSPDRLAAAVYEAYQSIVFLFLRVLEVTVTNSVSEYSPWLGMFTDKDGKATGMLFDPIWLMWINGKLPSTIGEHESEIELPNGWGQTINGKYERVQGLHAKFQVIALVVTHRGEYSEHALLRAADHELEKLKLTARFDPNKRPVSFRVIDQGLDLQQHLDKFTGLRMVTRTLLPRIDAFTQVGYMLWPPSEESMKKVEMCGREMAAKGEVDPSILGGKPIDDRSLEAIFDPIWLEYKQHLQKSM